MTKQVCIIKAGEKLPALAGVAGDYEDWIAAGMGLTAEQLNIIAVPEGAALPPLDTVAAVVITGSGAMVTERLPWMLATEAWLRDGVAADVPVLGICFGHQLLAQALGGEVDYNPRGVEVGTVTITLTSPAQTHPLFAGMPAEFPAQVSHRQSVRVPPPGAQVLAASDLDPHQACAMANRAVGLQFHPEFSDTVVRAYVGHYATRLAEEAKHATRILAGTRPSPEANSLLRRFAHWAGLLDEKAD
jgi:GMP synthase (glutamine-hydrolysing)